MSKTEQPEDTVSMPASNLACSLKGGTIFSDLVLKVSPAAGTGTYVLTQIDGLLTQYVCAATPSNAPEGAEIEASAGFLYETICALQNEENEWLDGDRLKVSHPTGAEGSYPVWLTRREILQQYLDSCLDDGTVCARDIPNYSLVAFLHPQWAAKDGSTNTRGENITLEEAIAQFDGEIEYDVFCAGTEEADAEYIE